MPVTSNLAATQAPDLPLDSSLQRLPRWITAAGIAGALGFLLAGQPRFAAGLGLGAGVALLGYWWLYRGLQAAFDSGSERAPKMVLLRLALRYPLVIGAVLLFEQTGWLPARAVVLGLFAPLAAVLIECLALAAQAVRGLRPHPKAGASLQ